ncbi:MAG: DUF6084 family protein [Acidimicrobiales bacterium]
MRITPPGSGTSCDKNGAVMSELRIQVLEGKPDPFAAVPTLLLRLRITQPESEPIHTIALRAQIRIEPQRRRYSPEEEHRLLELFGETPQWGESLRPFLWTHVSTTVAGFTGSIEVDLPVPCTYDFEVAAAKYLHSLGDGDIPIVLLFNGTVFSEHEGRLMVQPVPWHVEAQHLLPVSVWRQMMDGFFPNSGWIRLQRETIDALTRYKAERALSSWEQTFERLLKEADQ